MLDSQCLPWEWGEAQAAQGANRWGQAGGQARVGWGLSSPHELL